MITQNNNSGQEGIALVITFLLLTIMLAIVLSLSTILFNQIKITGNMGNSLVAFYSAETGAERALYIDRKQTVKCLNCTINYDGIIGSAAFTTITNRSGALLSITSRGYYKDASRSVTIGGVK